MLLHDWINEREWSAAFAAEIFGVPVRTLYSYLRGTRRPSGPLVHKIEKVTDGRVTGADFGKHFRAVKAERTSSPGSGAAATSAP